MTHYTSVPIWDGVSIFFSAVSQSIGSGLNCREGDPRGARVRKPGFLSLLLVVALGVLYFTVPAQDLLETVYDESQSLPYESVAVFSIAVTETIAETSAARPAAPLPGVVCLRKFGAQLLSHGTGLRHPMFDFLHSLRC
jgi:hypothetical protein